MLYGPTGIGKTFLALDWAMSICSGQPWFGQEVRKGQVLYVLAEGGCCDALLAAKPFKDNADLLFRRMLATRLAAAEGEGSPSGTARSFPPERIHVAARNIGDCRAKGRIVMAIRPQSDTSTEPKGVS